MELTIDVRTLRDAVRVARRIIPRQSTLPVLMHVLLTARDGRLTVTADNLEARTCRALSAIVSEPGAATVNARALLDVLGAIKGEVSVELLSARRVRVAGGGVEMILPTIDVAEFPAGREHGERSGTLTVNAGPFRDTIERAIRAAATDDARPVLAGIQLEAGDGGLTVAAADGFRLFAQTVETWPGNLSALVPWRTLAEMVRAAKRDDVLDIGTFDHTTISKNSQGKETSFTDRTFRLATPDGSWWTSRTIDGKFPDFRRIIPSPDSIVTRVTVIAEDLRRAAVLARSMAYSEVMRLDVRADNLIASMNDGENGSGSFTLPAGVVGDAMQLAIRATFLRDALAGIADDVTLELVGPASPVTVYATKDGSARHFIMPMNVGR